MFPHEFKRWMRHVASVPKGYLRTYVLKLLSEKPMSGAEIMDEISRRTGGFWKPSPGSIYPLLAWLQDNGYISEVQTIRDGSKRYTLTDKGRKVLKEFEKSMGEKWWFKWGWLPLWPSSFSSELRGLVAELLSSLQYLLGVEGHEDYLEEIAEAEEALRNALEEIHDILKRLRDKRGGRDWDASSTPFKWTPF